MDRGWRLGTPPRITGGSDLWAVPSPAAEVARDALFGTPVSDAPTLRDTFATGTTQAITAYDPAWVTWGAGGALTVSASSGRASGDGRYAYRSDSPEGDLVAEIVASGAGGQGFDYGPVLLLRATPGAGGTGTGYVALLSAARGNNEDRVFLYRVVDGVFNYVWDFPTGVFPKHFGAGQDHRLRVRVRDVAGGVQVTVWVNGNALGTYTDTDPGRLLTGACGIGSYGPGGSITEFAVYTGGAAGTESPGGDGTGTVATGDISGTGSGGAESPGGSGTGTLAFVGSASGGSEAPGGAASGVLSFVGAASGGSDAPGGAGAATLAFTGPGTGGGEAPGGDGAGALAFTGSGDGGPASPGGDGTAALAFTGAGAGGSEAPGGDGAGSSGVSGAGSGGSESAGGSGTGALVFAATGDGGAPAAGGEGAGALAFRGTGSSGTESPGGDGSAALAFLGVGEGGGTAPGGDATGVVLNPAPSSVVGVGSGGTEAAGGTGDGWVFAAPGPAPEGGAQWQPVRARLAGAGTSGAPAPGGMGRGVVGFVGRGLSGAAAVDSDGDGFTESPEDLMMLVLATLEG